MSMRLEPSAHPFYGARQLDDVEGHAPADWFFLVGHIDNSAAAFADFLESL